MLSVFICEDDPKQRERLRKIVTDYIMIEALDMELALDTGDPVSVLDYLERHPKTTGLYFLDVDLQHEMSGIALASEIRERDDSGKIVFVTTHGELSYLTFIYKVEAMDYIIKDRPDEIERKVRECIAVADKRHLSDSGTQSRRFKVKVGEKTRSIDHKDIMFFESSSVPHKIILHMDNSQLEFYGSIKELEEIGGSFYRCHKSYVVNKDNIKSVDRAKREIEMINEEICLVSVRALKGLD
ncbi:LytR/AlgR family response regulator transcription factor [Saccharibacillus alkalitolerans]|uniref:Response regulator transcription factor n=1 Tax=Saccharibacillus alkalitolerans TaxID=2705290 RepID=A0ABX0F2T9_9BACL|nr:LytTR family DNA-binding domain-containing protein [Saccharibacillus alkalitolerans]NGZ75308.1 response regulator transcription factor [Saccharibacillus alkalitolerans]